MSEKASIHIVVPAGATTPTDHALVALTEAIHKHTGEPAAAHAATNFDTILYISSSCAESISILYPGTPDLSRRGQDCLDTQSQKGVERCLRELG